MLRCPGIVTSNEIVTWDVENRIGEDGDSITYRMGEEWDVEWAIYKDWCLASVGVDFLDPTLFFLRVV